MIETIAQQDARRRMAIIGASLAVVKALVHAAAVAVFYILDHDVVGAGLQLAGTVIWAGKAAWEVL